MLIVNTIRGSVREYSYRLVSYAEILLKFISSDLGVRPQRETNPRQGRDVQG